MQVLNLIRDVSKKRIFLLLLFSVGFMLTRVLGLYGDTINPDGVNWHKRSEQFIVGIKTGDFEKTYQHYHPGITLMWIVGPVVETVKQVSPEDQFYNIGNFLVFDYVAKFSLVVAQLILTLAIIYVVSLSYGFSIALLFASALSLEPFFLGNSRLLHMDVLFALFLFLALITVQKGLVQEKIWFVLCGAGLLALAFLTKSIGIGALVYSLLFAIALQVHRKKFSPKNLAVLLVVFCLTMFVFFPAMWVRPWFYLTEIFREGSRVGLRNGHSQIFFGRFTEDPGALFYPTVIFVKTSPFILFGLLAYVLGRLRNSGKIRIADLFNSQVLFLTTFYLGYFTIMTLSSKKLDRYMIPVFPYLVLLATLGYQRLLEMSSRAKAIMSLFVLFFLLVPLIQLYPYYFTYTTPLLGSSSRANEIIGQKPFGIGITELRDHVVSRYGSVKLGFIDTKPMESIYPNSKVFDIRVDGTRRYDLIVLAINESFPDKVLDSEEKFKKDSSLYINGLEYWRIYAKEIR